MMSAYAGARPEEAEHVNGMTLVELGDAQYLELAAAVRLPVEQSPRWDAYDRVVPGREPWRRYGAYRGEQAVALLSFARYRGRGFSYLWAKHGPVWLAEPSAGDEQELRDALVATVRTAAPKTTFVRLHARHPGPGLEELLQTITYDHTVVLELTGRSDDDLLAGMKKRGRRDLRKGLREQPIDATEATGLSVAEFSELYAVLEETAGRDGFGVHPIGVYTEMLSSLGPHVARLFVGRWQGTVQAWALATVYDGACMVHYAASTQEGRRYDAPTQLYWHMIRVLRDEGVATFDLMGVGSELAPSLAPLTTMKTKFTPEITEVAPAWDVPVRPVRYRALRAALALKRHLLAAARRLRSTIKRAPAAGRAEDTQ